MCLYMYACGQKKIESHFSDRLKISNIRGRTSRQIYRLALPLLSPEHFPCPVNQGFSYLLRTLLLEGKSTIPSPLADRKTAESLLN